MAASAGVVRLLGPFLLPIPGRQSRFHHPLKQMELTLRGKTHSTIHLIMHQHSFERDLQHRTRLRLSSPALSPFRFILQIPTTLLSRYASRCGARNSLDLLARVAGCSVVHQPLGAHHPASAVSQGTPSPYNLSSSASRSNFAS